MSTETKQLLEELIKIVDNLIVPQIKRDLEISIDNRLANYVIINQANWNRFNSDKRNCCCFLMFNYQSNGKTLKDLAEFLCMPFNNCPFCGMKI